MRIAPSTGRAAGTLALTEKRQRDMVDAGPSPYMAVNTYVVTFLLRRCDPGTGWRAEAALDGIERLLAGPSWLSVHI